MTLLHFSRRTHLYLGLGLLPWFLVYAVSSIPFSHNQYFESLDKAKGLPNWTPRFERHYEIAIPETGSLRPAGARILKDTGIQGAFGAYRQGPNQINVYVHSFWKSTQLKYFIAEKRLVAEDKRFRWDHFLTGMHAKGGFEQGGLHDVWGVIVDFVCLGMLLWVLTGVLMWWKLPSTRAWGWAALAAGCASFALFLVAL
ncbi:MAG: hypothetical protein HXY18_13225 [Bryobacteraceae bacterium]|nr:hypothetical protein [Bryobacteraceae bacterium]